MLMPTLESTSVDKQVFFAARIASISMQLNGLFSLRHLCFNVMGLEAQLARSKRLALDKLTAK
jgi:hypothetical protein